MKKFLKLLTLVMALLMLVSCFVACGGTTETETENNDTETVAETEVETKNLDAYGREVIADGIPTDVNYSNRTDNVITFFTRSDSVIHAIEMDADELIEDTLNDAIYRRNVTVEERLGVTIAQISQPGCFGPHTEWLQTLRNAVNTKSGDFDAAAVYASQGSPLAIEGMYYNVSNLEQIDLEKPWWNKAVVKDLELFDTIFFLSGGLAISQITESGAVYYNKGLLEKYHSGLKLYDLVDSKEWTIDTLYDLSSSVWEDANLSGVIDDGDTVGYVGWAHDGKKGWMDAWIAAMDIYITEKNSDGIPELVMYSERTIDAFEKIQKLHRENAGGLTKNGLVATAFINDNILFETKALRDGETLRDMTSPYGVVPFPLYNEEQDGYFVYPQNGCSLITVISTLAEERKEMIGYTIELMAAESYRQVTPEYYSVVLKSKYSADADDARMYDIILEGIRIDFGFVYASTMLGGPNNLFREIDRDFASEYDSHESTYLTKLETLIDALDELSFKLEQGE